MLEVKNVSKIYDTSKYIKEKVFENFSFVIKDKEKVAIVGKSGAGKSTLLNIMSCIDKPTEGEVIFDGECTSLFNEKKSASHRINNYGFVFQKYYLMPTLNVKDNILLPLVMGKIKIDEKYFEDLAKGLEISELLNKMPNQLSGGQQQRVAIARALINKPKIVFADEMTGNLDQTSGENVMKLIFKMAEEYEQTLVFVTHDMDFAKMADRILIIKDGIINEADI